MDDSVAGELRAEGDERRWRSGWGDACVSTVTRPKSTFRQAPLLGRQTRLAWHDTRLYYLIKSSFGVFADETESRPALPAT